MNKQVLKPLTPANSALRFQGVSTKAIPLLREVERALQADDLARAERSLALVMVMAPLHPHTLRLLGRCQFRRGLWANATNSFADVLISEPEDVDTLIELGKAQSAGGDSEAAIATLRKATALRPTPETLLELGVLLDCTGDAQGALDVANQAIACDATCERARLLRARSLQALGDIDATADEYRELIRRRQQLPAAWFALMDIKTVYLSEDERAGLRSDMLGSAWNEVERCWLGFAYGRACEDAGAYPAAVEAFATANHLARRKLIWDSAKWGAEVDTILDTFAAVTASAPAELGSEVIFIVGLPRSGTTVVEQILGSHPQVEGANELPDLAAIIDGETKRLRKPFAQWAALASNEDWERLGKDYLERTRRWRTFKPIHTDKMPENWIYTAAIRAMLPAARVIDSRRDRVETGWSCFKQLFAPNRVAWSYSYAELSAYWRDYDRYMRSMLQKFPQHVFSQSHESLVTDLEPQVRDLLNFCGLPFDSVCLQPHRSDRVVRTASSAQVRRPIARVTSRSSRYGPALDLFVNTMSSAENPHR